MYHIHNLSYLLSLSLSLYIYIYIYSHKILIGYLKGKDVIILFDKRKENEFFILKTLHKFLFLDP